MIYRKKWGILGTSYISEVLAKAIIASETGELVAIASRSEDRAQAFARKFSLNRHYGAYSSLLADPDIDVVYIGLPNHVHKEWIIKAAQAGKHILCEKPLVLTVEEMHVVMAQVRDAHVVCMEALMYRHHPFIHHIKQVVLEKRLGEIRYVNGLYCANIAHRANTIAGGSIRNLGCYPLSLLRFLLDEDPIKMVSISRTNEKNAVRQASAIFQYAQGIIATISTADDLEMAWRFEMIGLDADLIVESNPWLPTENQNRALLKNKSGYVLQSIATTAHKPLYSYQIDALGDAIDGSHLKSQKLISLEESLGTIQVMEQWMKQIAKANVLANEC